MARAKRRSTAAKASEPAEQVELEKLHVGILSMQPSEQRDAAVAATIVSFGRQLAEQGKSPTFEVHYPAPDDMSADDAREWLGREPGSFDVVELVDFEKREDGRVVGGEIKGAKA